VPAPSKLQAVARQASTVQGDAAKGQALVAALNARDAAKVVAMIGPDKARELARHYKRAATAARWMRGPAGPRGDASFRLSALTDHRGHSLLLVALQRPRAGRPTR
jgi:7-keto-8-aminopelargonate synthetase-like enzyme